jgi:hypothetical protein
MRPFHTVAAVIIFCAATADCNAQARVEETLRRDITRLTVANADLFAQLSTCELENRWYLQYIVNHMDNSGTPPRREGGESGYNSEEDIGDDESLLE